jgi:PKD repeat protein
VHNYYNRGNYDVTLIAYDENSCSDTLSKTGYIIVGGGSSINNISRLGIEFYPNPAGDLFYIDAKQYPGQNDMQAEIYNTLGLLLIKEKLIPGSINQIDITQLKEGIYFLKLTADGIEGTEKFIKE